MFSKFEASIALLCGVPREHPSYFLSSCFLSFLYVFLVIQMFTFPSGGR